LAWQNMDVNPVFTGRDFKIDPKLCFVLMPLHDPYTSIFENHIKPVASKCGLIAKKADDITSNKPIMEDVWNHLNQARIVIADLTDSNPNVFYELGIAHTLGKEVIMIAQHVTKLPFDVGHVRYIDYVYPSQIEKFEARLEDTIKKVLKDSTVEVRLVEQKQMSPLSKGASSVPTVRLSRLANLTSWAREWTTNNYMRLIHNGLPSYSVSEWNVFERVNNVVRTEAVRLWSLSSSTAKDYADTVMLTIEPEFKSVVTTEAKKERDKYERERRERAERIALRKETYLRLETQANLPVDPRVFVKELLKTGKFDEQQADKAVNDLVQEGTVGTLRNGFMKRYGEFRDWGF
jgi:nucleoside 2-deoxyribosyltransferase